MDMTEEEIFEELTAFFDGNKYAAAGLMGNFWIESHIESDRLSGNGKKKVGMDSSEYTEAVDNGTYDNFVHDGCGYGLAQLTYYAKKQGLYDMALETGLSVGSARLQIAHLEQELIDRPELLEELKKSKSAYDAGVRFMMGYEGPADKSGENQDNRGNISEKYYDMYKNLKYDNSYGNLFEDIYLDVGKVEEITETLETKIKSINITSIDIASICVPLTSLGIATNLVSSLKSKIQRVEDNVLDACQNIMRLTSEQTETDNEFVSKEKDVSETTKGSYYRTGGTNYDSGGSNIKTSETSVDNSNKDLNINTSFKNELVSFNAESYSSLMTALYALDGGLLKYLESPDLGENLKKELLNNPNLKDDVKKVIMKMDPETLRVELIDIIGNTNMFSDESKKLIYNFFNYTGNRDVLLSNISKYLEVGKKMLDGDTQKNLLDLYDGDKQNDKNVDDFYKLFAEQAASDNDVTVESLLTGESHEMLVNKELSETVKVLSYLEAISSFDENTKTDIINKIVTGGMYK